MSNWQAPTTTVLQLLYGVLSCSHRSKQYSSYIIPLIYFARWRWPTSQAPRGFYGLSGVTFIMLYIIMLLLLVCTVTEYKCPFIHSFKTLPCSVPVRGSKMNVLSMLPPVMLYVKDALSRSVALTWSSRSPGLVDSLTSI